VDLANRLTQLLCRPTPEGACYRVDLRLRPEGAMGEVVTALRSAVDYYHQRARDWELQMLIKARPTAGSLKLGRTFLDSIGPLIYQTSTDFSTIERVAETRDRIQEKLRRRGGSGLNIKLTRGGIRDIEFLVQCLQRLYGGRDPWVRSGGTLFALHRLRDKGYLSMPDYARLNSAYQYLRVLEHRLQIEDDRQTHTLPSGRDALELLARKMHGVHSPGKADDELLRQVQSHLKNVAEIYERVVHTQRPIDLADEEPPPDAALDHGPEPQTEHSWRSQLLHLEQKSPRVAAVLRAVNIRWGRSHFEHFLNKIISMPALLAELEALPSLLECAADLIEHSPYLAEHLIRHPEDLARLREAAGGAEDENASSEPWPGSGSDVHPEMEQMLAGGSTFEEKSTWLRHFYRLQMLEILAESVYRHYPIFATLGKTSRLAEWVVRAAYRIAVEDVVRFSNWSGPREHLSVIALGRLGMREFDLASDADLIFVIPDEERPQHLHWLQVVERLIEITSSYTREGLIFTVDTRLRPMGRDGELVQTESYYNSYFASQAEAWEAITYMKARTIAGNIEHGKKFLCELQDVGWRRFGRSGELTSMLVGMRERLEREQGADSPIKAGAGGYYDIDFILMYLRLRDAGIFFESLNTPERIEVVRALGGLTDDQAQKLLDTAVFFRSLDHGIRVCLGHSAGAIPVALQKRAPITGLTRRWSELPPADTPLGPFFQQTRRATRELFTEIFKGKDGSLAS
jgi:glutamate-ammonia-ligase adenylyltransferase